MNNQSNIPSAKGKYWKIRDYDENYVTAAMQQYGLSHLLARILFGKSVLLEEIPNFLEPKLKKMMPDPYVLKDMPKAVERIINAINNNEKIALYGDYDVDGATSTAILTRFLKSLDSEPLIHIPDRLKEGYGINTEALLKLKEKGAKLIISLDCGVTAFEPISEAKKAGLDVVVIDHHLSSDTFPDAVAIVNPNRFDDVSGLNNLCAAGVCFLLCVALNRKLRENGYFQNHNEPDLLSLLDLVALGTVCDVMTLTGLNRAFVNQGLKIIVHQKNRGIKNLCDIAGLSKKADAYTLGFLVGPRINAAGRIGDCSLGTAILATEDEQFAKETAEILNNLNKDRQEMEKKIIAEAIKQAEAQNYKSNPLIVVYSDDWHPGIIGIVAGRLKEMFNKPAAVIAFSGEVGKASARSVNGIDFGAAIANAKNAGLVVNGGGHKAAAGFTVEKHLMADLYDYLCQQFEKSYNDFANDNHSECDLLIKVSSATIDLINELEKLSPFGNGNPEPLLMLDDAKIVKMKIAGEKHIQVYIAESGLARNSATIKGVAFNSVGTPLGDALEAAHMKNVSLLGKLRKNIWNGNESVEFHIEDMIVKP